MSTINFSVRMEKSEWLRISACAKKFGIRKADIIRRGAFQYLDQVEADGVIAPLPDSATTPEDAR